VIEAVEVGAVLVPSEAMEMRAVRSGGPGGQNVNKVASKVELRVDLARVVGLSLDAMERLKRLAGRRLDADGWLLVQSQKTRDQGRNLDDARDKVRGLIEEALVAPRPRRATRPSRAAKRRRLDDKRRTSEKKANRQGRGD
jgi:ribosome-associated protein